MIEDIVRTIFFQFFPLCLKRHNTFEQIRAEEFIENSLRIQSQHM